MQEAIYERMTLAISSADLEFSATCRSLRFDGFTRVYETAQDDDSNSEQEPVLPDMQVGQALDVENIIASQAFSRPRGRYTEATLVRELEQRGIGRPSTYASTISVIKKRGYVQKRDADGVKRWCEELVLKGEHITRQTREEMAGKERSKLVPTDLGLVVTDYLMRHFDRVMDYEFTAKIESELDAIANNERNWQQMLAGFYGPFHTLVEETRASPDRIESKRMLGVDPFSGQPVSGRLGRFGPVIMIGEAGAPGADQSARFHSLRPGQSIFTITLQEALDLFNLPRTLGEIDGKPVLADVNERGGHVKHDGIYAALDAGKGDVPETVSLERALELLKMRQEAQARRIIKTFPDRPDMIIVKKRWDAFLKIGRIEIKIPRDIPSDLTLEQALQLAEAHQPKKKAKTRGKRGTKGAGIHRAPKKHARAKKSQISE
jgi:DNA topoisomerase-1